MATATSKTKRKSFVQNGFRNWLSHAENSRSRRAKSLVKQGAVESISVKDAVIAARVKNERAGSQSYQVELPAFAWWAPSFQQMAEWLSERTDWLADLMQNQWPQALLEAAADVGLGLFPTDELIPVLLEKSSCSCFDSEVPCQHMIAVVVSMMEIIEDSPLQALEYVGITTSDLLDRVHTVVQQFVEKQAEIEAPYQPHNTGDNDSVGLDQDEKEHHRLTWGTQEQHVFVDVHEGQNNDYLSLPGGRIVIQLDDAKRLKLRHDYIAWD